MSEKYLFIGGLADLERHEIPGTPAEVSMADRSPGTGDLDTSGRRPFDFTLYKRHLIDAPDRHDLYVYVDEDLPGDGSFEYRVLRHLIFPDD